MRFAAFEPIALNNSDDLEIMEIYLTHIFPDEQQPRKNFEDNSLDELAVSIKEQGVIQPIIVKKMDNTTGRYQIVAGERRWRAAFKAGLEKIPAIVRDYDELDTLAVALVENIQRQNLSALEEAVTFARFKDEFGMTHEDIANMVGRSRVSITNTMRLLSLCDFVKQLLEEGRVEVGHARSLLTLNENEQIALADKIVAQGLTVRQTEKLVEGLKRQYRQIDNNPKASANDHKQLFWSDALTQKLSTPVAVKLNHSGGGTVTIHFKSAEDLALLIERIP